MSNLLEELNNNRNIRSGLSFFHDVNFLGVENNRALLPATSLWYIVLFSVFMS